MLLTQNNVANPAGLLFDKIRIPVAIYSGNPVKLLYSNAALRKILDIAEDDAATSQNFLDIAPQNWPISAISQVIGSGADFSFTEESGDGTQLLTHSLFYSTTGSGENRVFHFIHSKDKNKVSPVSTRAEIWQHFSEIITNTAGAGTFFVDLVSGEFRASSGLVKILTGSEESTVNRRTLRKYIHPQDWMSKKQLEVLFTEGLSDYHFRCIWPDGSIHNLKTSASAFNGRDGHPEYLFGAVVDNTEAEHLKEQERNLMQLAENSMDLMAIVNLDQQITYLNTAGKNMLGISDRMPLSKFKISEFFDQDYLPQYEQEINATLKTSGNWSGKFGVCSLNSSEQISCMANFVAIRNSKGKLQNIGITLRDLRPDLQKQQELEMSERQFRNFVVQAPVAICIISEEDLKVEIANQALLELLGKGEDVVGKRFDEVFSEIKETICPDNIPDLIKRGGRHAENECKAEVIRNGRQEVVYFNYTLAPMQNQFGGHSSVMLVMVEVTEQIKAKRELERSEKRFRAIVKEAPVAKALYVGENMQIDLANEAMIKLWGKDESVIGKPLEEALPELEGQPFLDLLRQVYTTGVAYHTDQQSADLVVDGKLQKFWFNFTYKPLHDGDGNIYAILNTAVDITEHIRQQQQKDNFIGIASHELKTPVTSIKAYNQVLENLLRRSGDTEKADIVLKMDRQINRLTRLIGDLLDTTKIDTGKIRFNRVDFDFEDMLNEVVEETQRISDQHHIVLKASSIGTVYADRERISQVIINFITNAIKYSPTADKVIVHATKTGDGVEVGVQDFGIGISPENCKKVFEQFYRVSGNKEHTFPGLGLGLYISAQIIEREGGKIWVESEIGKGSVFKFYLPFKADSRL